MLNKSFRDVINLNFVKYSDFMMRGFLLFKQNEKSRINRLCVFKNMYLLFQEFHSCNRINNNMLITGKYQHRIAHDIFVNRPVTIYVVKFLHIHQFGTLSFGILFHTFNRYCGVLSVIDSYHHA